MEEKKVGNHKIQPPKQTNIVLVENACAKTDGHVVCSS